MVAEVEAEALSAFHGTTSALERQVEAMEDKFMLLHLVSRRYIAELREESDFNACYNCVDRLVIDVSLDSVLMKTSLENASADIRNHV
jgi:hypothetical protein